MASMSASHALAQLVQTSAHILQWSLSCMEHSAAHARAAVLHAWSIAIMEPWSNPIGRIIIRIAALATSAVLAHMLEHFPMPSSPAQASEHIVQACSHAAQASIHSCIRRMSMPCMSMVPIISLAIPTVNLLFDQSRQVCDRAEQRCLGLSITF
jgi:hypothetical protein